MRQFPCGCRDGDDHLDLAESGFRHLDAGGKLSVCTLIGEEGHVVVARRSQWGNDALTACCVCLELAVDQALLWTALLPDAGVHTAFEQHWFLISRNGFDVACKHGERCVPCRPPARIVVRKARQSGGRSGCGGSKGTERRQRQHTGRCFEGVGQKSSTLQLFPRLPAGCCTRGASLSSSNGTAGLQKNILSQGRDGRTRAQSTAAWWSLTNMCGVQGGNDRAVLQ